MRLVLGRFGNSKVRGILAAAMLISLQRCYRDPPPTAGQSFALQSIKEIVDAQEEFRKKDLDGNGQFDYWRKDISGLYYIPHMEKQIRLIRLSTALADSSPMMVPSSMVKERSAQVGYWFEALSYVEEDKERKRDTFAVIAKPGVSAPKGTLTFIANQVHVYQKDMLGNTVKAFPADPLQSGWTIVR